MAVASGICRIVAHWWDSRGLAFCRKIPQSKTFSCGCCAGFMLELSLFYVSFMPPRSNVGSSGIYTSLLRNGKAMCVGANTAPSPSVIPLSLVWVTHSSENRPICHVCGHDSTIHHTTTCQRRVFLTTWRQHTSRDELWYKSRLVECIYVVVVMSSHKVVTIS